MQSELNTDLSQRVVDFAAHAVWQPSPQAGVTRRMLDRQGAEVARATSVVRYAAGTHFPRHVHGGGEEILVLDGVFSDEFGDYPDGTYLRNPPQTAHAPFSKLGCTILVKLWQFQAGDQQSVQFNATESSAWQQADGIWTGLATQVLLLHTHAEIMTALCRLPADYTTRPQHYAAGLEILVLAGELRDASGCYPVGTWLRLPAGSEQSWQTGTQAVQLYVKIGHLTAQFLPLPIID